MQFVLKPDGVLVKHQQVRVVPERYRGVTELGDPVAWFEPSSHADLDHPFPERPEVRDHVHETSASVRCSLVETGDRSRHFSELGLCVGNRGGVAGCLERGENILAVGKLLLPLLVLALELTLCDLFFAKSCTFLTLLVPSPPRPVRGSRP